jgi:excisionase family DNA binding protein
LKDSEVYVITLNSITPTTLESAGVTEERFLKPAEVFRRLGIHPNTGYAWLRSGTLPCIRVGRVIRVPEKALADLVAR